MDNGASIMHKPIHRDWIDELGREIVRTYDITYSPRSDRQKWLCHKAICKHKIALGPRTLYSLIRKRPNKSFLEGVVLWRSFGAVVAALLFRRRISVWDIGIRRTIKYLAVSVLFGGLFASSKQDFGFHGSSKDIK